MKIINVTEQDQLDALYEQSALTWEGLSSNEKILKAVEGWLADHGAIVPNTEPCAHIITGALMNSTYGLTGNNAYPDDLTLVSVTDIDQMAVVTARFECGGRWFDDIVDNNKRREEEQA